MYEKLLSLYLFIIFSIIAYQDIKKYIIPHRLLIALITPVPFIYINNSFNGYDLLAPVVMFMLFLIPYLIGQIAAGDIKLTMATSLWIGLNENLIDYIILTFLLGGILSATILLFRYIPIKIQKRPLILQKDNGLPYGVPLSIAGFIIIIFNFG